MDMCIPIKSVFQANTKGAKCVLKYTSRYHKVIIHDGHLESISSIIKLRRQNRYFGVDFDIFFVNYSIISCQPYYVNLTGTGQEYHCAALA